MHSASQSMPGQGIVDRGLTLLGQARDWLDGYGRPGWIIAMILGFVLCWPVGLAILVYMIGSKRMFGCRSHKFSRQNSPLTGNSAFDAYRQETLKRLEEEQREFVDFLQKLREAKDKAEFDQFMDQRDSKPVS